MDASYRFKQYSHAQFNPPGGGGPGPGSGVTGPSGPSPTTSSPHSATHPSPMLANFARGYGAGQSSLDKIMGGYGDNSGGVGGGYGAGPSSNNNNGRSFSFGSNDFGPRGQVMQGQGHGQQQQGQGSNQSATGGTGQPSAKRGSKACVACESTNARHTIGEEGLTPGRKGKNRCENDPTTTNGICKRCAANGIQCVFEKASDRSRTRNESVTTEGVGGEADG